MYLHKLRELCGLQQINLHVYRHISKLKFSSYPSGFWISKHTSPKWQVENFLLVHQAFGFQNSDDPVATRVNIM